MIGKLNHHNFYPNLGTDTSFVLLPTHAITAIFSQSLADIIIQHHCFTYPDQTYLKHIFSITSNIKTVTKSVDLLFYTVYVESKMTNQPHYNAHTPFDILEYYTYVDAEESANAYITWKGYWYFILLIANVTRVTSVRFLKKKSNVLIVIGDFVFML